MKKTLLTFILVSYLNVHAQTPIHEFNFNGNLTNTSNSISFMGTDNFVADRAGVAKSAQRLANKALEAVIDNLPQDKSARTISIWIKFNDITTPNYIWGYGNASNAQYCGLLQQGTNSANSDLSLAAWGASNDIIVPTPLQKFVWYNYTITYEGVVSKIYRDGKLLKFLDGMSRSTKGNIFRIGEINTTIGINADIDDLKIYDVALTQDQVSELYNSSKPTVAAVETSDETKNGKGIVKANGAKTTGAITSKDVNVTKTIEVFSQGQKIIGNNSMSINDLPEGTYLLKITNTPIKKMSSK
ncbi:LamG-like jellyroll fold domain-containing protein [Flavobacterium reichenbachii]|uniref:LamG-like jellyroll fold domain-containing protein n=1 Tax=Flavobacterium reichenbachii TaxID=362418 RepID=A0A085ZN37_9FLAO|nr:LamG-like jellyroll fold domain-containing protein [Flavobacterium reichenbachii]KFF05851.1 hypothetical protein IW19_10100 [Flavobacterium reichenbachii]OXB12736.1 hypothetical protein B0A68_18280 [Flavobacterium reichenbachii]